MRRVTSFIRHLAGKSSPRAIALIFSGAVLVFTALLMLPISSAKQIVTPLYDALFTAVSALTVTGLTSVDTGSHWSLFGKIVILIAIQAGGLGVVTIALLLALAVTRRLGVSGRVFAREAMGSSGLGDVGQLLRVVVATTFAIEGVLAALLIPAFAITEGSWLLGLWHGIFYAVSGFTNAGFTPHVGGLEVFAGNWFVLTPVALGVFVGSFGFPVFLKIIRVRWARKKWTLHTKITLITTTALLFVGAFGYLIFEWTNPGTIGDLPWWQKLYDAFFASTMMRSGGFNVVDTSASTPTTWLFSDAMMFVGGGSGSTAGGIKVTTLAVLLLAIVAEARGTKDTNALGRRIPNGIQRLAISVVFLGATIVFIATALITVVSDAKLDRILFEVISAFATCGLSVGISAEVAPFGQYVLAAVMLIGRLGPIVFASALAVRQRREEYVLPNERLIIG